MTPLYKNTLSDTKTITQQNVNTLNCDRVNYALQNKNSGSLRTEETSILLNKIIQVLYNFLFYAGMKIGASKFLI